MTIGAEMTCSSPRIAWPLVQAIDELDEPDLPIAELWRRLRCRAGALGLSLPSYEQTRVLVHRARDLRAMPGIGDLAVDVLFRTRAPSEARVIAERRLQERRAAHAAVEAERTWRSADPRA